MKNNNSKNDTTNDSSNDYYPSWKKDSNNYKKFFLIPLCICLIIIGLFMVYQKFLSNSHTISDEEYIRLKEEYQNEQEEKEKNYSLSEKIQNNKQINISIINSSMRNDSMSYPFNDLYKYLNSQNIHSGIYEINSKSYSYIFNNILSDDENSENLKNSDVIILSSSKENELTPDSLLSDFITNISSENDKEIKFFIVVESYKNINESINLKQYSKNNNITFLDLSKMLEDADNTEIKITKNNQENSSKKYSLYCTSIISELEK